MANKQENTIRILHRAVAKDSKNNSRGLLGFVDLAIVLLISVSIAALLGTLDVGLQADALPAAVLTLTVQSLALLGFILTDKHDVLLSRTILLSYWLFNVYILFFADVLPVASYWLLSYILFAIAATKQGEGILWIILHGSTLFLAVLLDQTSESPTLNIEEVKILGLTFITLTIFGSIIDFAARFVSQELQFKNKYLRLTNSRYNTILNAVDEGMVAIDGRGIVEFTNQKALDILQFEKKDLIGQAFTGTILMRDTNDQLITHANNPVASMLRARSEAQPQSIDEIILVGAKHQKINVRLSLAPIISQSRVRGILVLFHNQTSERQIDSAKEDFVALASHQLRTPLNVVNWYSEKLLSEKHGQLNDKQKEYIETIRDNGERMTKLAASIVDASKLEVGKESIRAEPFSLEEVITNSMQTFQALAEQKNIQVANEHESIDLNLTGYDKSHIQLVVDNILSNALHYSHPDSAVKFETQAIAEGGRIPGKNLRAEKESVMLSVTDKGIGLSSDEVEKVFSKLFRGNHAGEMYPDGVGLGLYISSLTLQLYNATIWMQSNKSSGTRVSVLLPKDVHTEAAQKG